MQLLATTASTLAKRVQNAGTAEIPRLRTLLSGKSLPICVLERSLLHFGQSPNSGMRRRSEVRLPRNAQVLSREIDCLADDISDLKARLLQNLPTGGSVPSGSLGSASDTPNPAAQSRKMRPPGGEPACIGENATTPLLFSNRCHSRSASATGMYSNPAAQVMTSKVADGNRERDDASSSMKSTFVRPDAVAAALASRSMPRGMSTPYTWPSRPTILAAAMAAKPVPVAASSTQLPVRNGQSAIGRSAHRLCHSFRP